MRDKEEEQWEYTRCKSEQHYAARKVKKTIKWDKICKENKYTGSEQGERQNRMRE